MPETARFDSIPAGTFEADLSGSQKKAIRDGLEIARNIIQNFPLIAADYRTGLSQAAIVKKYQLADVFKTDEQTTTKAVSVALRGYDGKFRNLFPEIDNFPGLIGGEGMDILAQEHRQRSGEAQWIESGGIHAQTTDERIKVGRQGAVAQGKNPLSNNEIAEINLLAAQVEFQRNTRINAQKIADALNKKFYQGRDVRTPRQIVKFLSREKNK
jgi:hypothetical protein